MQKLRILITTSTAVVTALRFGTKLKAKQAYIGTSWSNLLPSLLKKLRGNNGITDMERVAVATTAYNIWKVRNLKVFQQIKMHETTVVLKIQEEVPLRLSKRHTYTQRSGMMF